MPVQSYRDLIAWQKAMDLTTECYRITQPFPKTETFGLAAQIQRNAALIPSEIAHGHGCSTTRDYLRHLGNANGFRCQLETQIMVSHRVGILPKAELDEMLERTAEVGRILTGLIHSLERKLD